MIKYNKTHIKNLTFHKKILKFQHFLPYGRLYRLRQEIIISIYFAILK